MLPLGQFRSVLAVKGNKKTGMLYLMVMNVEWANIAQSLMV
jgi:hypothetical protein